jgi:hypothetical protein
MTNNEISVEGLIREMSVKIGEVTTENIALRLQVAELVALLNSPPADVATEQLLAQAYDQRID